MMSRASASGKLPRLLQQGGYALGALALLVLPIVWMRPVIGATSTTTSSTTGLTLPDSPLITESTIAPNVLFVLDDSGSMANPYMPDDVPKVGTTAVGGATSTDVFDDTCDSYVNNADVAYLACNAYTRNTIYYNPATTYYPWTLPTSSATTTYRMSGGTDYTAAYADTMFVPYSGTGPAGSGTITTTSTTVDLSSSVRTFYVPKDTTQTANSYLGLATNYYRYQILTDGTIWRSYYGSVSSTGSATAVSVSNSSGTLNGSTTATLSSVSSGLALTITITSKNSQKVTYTVTSPSSATVCSGNVTNASATCAVGSTASGVYKVALTGGSNSNSASYAVSASTTPTDRCSVGTGTGTGTSDWVGCTEVTPTGRNEAAERTNYATWYSYYRTRTKAAKAGASAAFAELDDSVRVGYRTINSRGACYDKTSYSNPSSGTATGTCKTSYASTYNLPTQSVPIPVNYNNGVFSDSSTTTNNRTQWYNRLFSTVPASSTPLRGALQSAGAYFSSDASTGAYGPESSKNQYACRQNFTILTTDGYWNEDSYSNSTIGDSDSTNGTTYTSSSGTSAGYTAENPYKGGLAKNSASGSASSPTLADVANYYWKNDLRTDLSNIVPTSTTLSTTSTPDPAFWQHMVTFTIGLGLSGTVNESSVYQVLNQGYATYTSGSSTVTGWPTPTNNTSTTIDDLLHAAVNGHGTYVAASDPDAFATGLTNALAAVAQRTGSFSNVTSQNTSVSSDNYLFISNYVSNVWTGALYACAATDSTCTSPLWTTATTLASQYDGTSTTSIASRGIYTCGTLASDGTCTGASFPTTAQQTTLGGAAVTNYLRGLQTGELQNGGSYRNRSTLLGDIVDSSPAYVSATDTVYVGGNDGMLHAFAASTGKELFAYIPASVIGSDLASLASTSYSHKYFVDGPITVSTTAQTTSKNVLVGALGRGGKGLYALNVTSPTSFSASKVMWEVTETTGTTGNMGKILGQPFIAKLNNGVTALVTGNGVNSSNGHAVLLVYNVLTGALIKQIDTGVGGTTTSTTNGLFAPTGWDSDGSGTVDYVYAGDLQGNVWKFDLSSTSTGSWALGNSSKPLFTATYTSGTTSATQPITSGMLVAENSSTGKTWVFFGTGKYLEQSDISNTAVQAMYGFIDPSQSTSTLGTTLTPSSLKSRAMYSTTTTSGSSTTSVRSFEAYSALDTSTYQGWYIDLVVDGGTAAGERVVQTPESYGSYLVFSTIIPSESTGCSSSGTSWLYALDMFTGTSGTSSYFDLNGDGTADTTARGTAVGGVSVTTGMSTLAALLNGKAVVNDSSGAVTTITTTSVTPTRVSWREIRKEN